ncbi:hypothetical protein [Stagnihabitans tardus]|uniref:Uncharacterized protein n=1 Tax=Stagnihabitans tardus TaxID=2699202 RepID=A0AAE4YFJ8_9RHOB|nr:hypothetical protein [Stagnihabitans tardus]NBZ88725.1 hypothetical protein [Stagnihabitans tardus]
MAGKGHNLQRLVSAGFVESLTPSPELRARLSPWPALSRDLTRLFGP